MFPKSVSVLIDRPIDEVFSFLADARNRPQWDESVDKEELTSPEPIGVGSTIRTTFRSMGREYHYTSEIVEHVRPNGCGSRARRAPSPRLSPSSSANETAGPRWTPR